MHVYFHSLFSYLQSGDPGAHIRTRRPTVQLPEEDRFVICVEEVEVVHTDDFLSALELYFAVVFMLNLSYATKITKFSTFVQHFWLGIRDSNVSKQMRRLYAQLVKGKALYK